jgi:MEMO1 family protein
MNHNKFILSFILSVLIFTSPSWCQKEITRGPVDTIGFAQYAWQMDSIMARISRYDKIQTTGTTKISDKEVFRMAICPHDDYTYAGPLYPKVLSHIKAPVVILFGVAHKARALGIEDRIVFDRYPGWKEPYGITPVSSLRENILSELDTTMFFMSDTLQKVEHSLEAIIPFLRYYNPKLEIVPILVPAMTFDRMKEISDRLADVILDQARKRGWEWGKDYVIVVSTDAVHYGDADWGGKNYAPYGTDSTGYSQAVQHEKEIICNTLTGHITEDRIRNFSRFTVDPDDYREYKWTWCGRYLVPFGMLTALNMAVMEKEPLEGIWIDYATSIDHPRLAVDDLGMGITAGASLHHWVGYVAIAYK